MSKIVDPLTIIRQTVEKKGHGASHVFVVFGASVSKISIAVSLNLMEKLHNNYPDNMFKASTIAKC